MKYFVITLITILTLSCDDITEIEDISGRVPLILAPVNESVLTTQDVTFTWYPMEDAERYTIQIARPNFEDALQIVLDSTVTSTSFTKSLDLGVYQWRVRAENSGYNSFFTTQGFSIEE